ncbi:MAG: glycine--tRNA ligase subunit beta, partial [Pseudomonadota bacterium]
WVFEEQQAARTLASQLQAELPKLLEALPSAKKMRWDNELPAFLRPVHGLMVLHGNTICPVSAFGCTSRNQTEGHRFMAPGLITIPEADQYEALLNKAHVILRPEQRQQAIIEHLTQKAEALGLTVRIDVDLLEEVTHITEWPEILAASFDAHFLSLPDAVPVTVMKVHQRYFPLFQKNGQLSNHFLFVTNIHAPNPKGIIAGNQRVIRARLSDAQYFFKTDLHTTLTHKSAGLAHILFQKRLGTLADKTYRIAAIAPLFEKTSGFSVSSTELNQAALLCKADLCTLMVSEFPELQGFMGARYAEHDKLPTAVCHAIEEHYYPRFSEDSLPASPLGTLLALADRLDTLLGFFAIGELPSGTKDPFALRRAAVGLLKILLEKGISLDITAVLTAAAASYPITVPAGTVETLVQFIKERLKVLFSDSGFSPQLSLAILNTTHTEFNPTELKQKIVVLHQFISDDAATPLLQAAKRLDNILKKQTTRFVLSQTVDFSEPAEHTLFAAYQNLSQSWPKSRTPEAQLQLLNACAEPIASFFEAVMVMAEDKTVRERRLALLQGFHDYFSDFAEFSAL